MYWLLGGQVASVFALLCILALSFGFARAAYEAGRQAYQEATTWHLQRPPLDAAK